MIWAGHLFSRFFIFILKKYRIMKLIPSVPGKPLHVCRCDRGRNKGSEESGRLARALARPRAFPDLLARQSQRMASSASQILACSDILHVDVQGVKGAGKEKRNALDRGRDVDARCHLVVFYLYPQTAYPKNHEDRGRDLR